MARAWVIGRLASVLALAAPLAVATGLPAASAAPSASGAQPATTGWTQQASANQLAPTGDLTAVSCPTMSLCVAVGYGVNPSGIDVPLAETDSSGTWSVVATPVPAGSLQAELDGVSCTSATSCEAVGYSEASTGQTALAELWNGTSWSIQATPANGKANDVQLQAVSCATASSCVAVGDAYTKAAKKQHTVVADVWNGTRWVSTKLSSPGGYDNELLGVSCAAAGSCEAVGYQESGSSVYGVLAESWNGSAWAVQPTPKIAGQRNGTIEAAAVSCPAVGTCELVGSYQDKANDTVPLAEGLAGGTWSLQHPIAPPADYQSDLTAVSCTGVASCTAVGAQSDGYNTLAEVWDGSAWSTTPTPDTSAGGGDHLLGLSCTSGGCTAVGDSAGTPAETTLALTEPAGGPWSLSAPVNPQGALNQQLDGVSCAAGSCEAAGVVEEQVLAEGSSGGAWALQSVPATSNGRGLAVACPAAGACEAVGTANGTVSVAFAESGGSWTEQATADPAGATQAELVAVSCPQVGSCVAVGQYVDASGHFDPLVEQLSGGTWTLGAAAVPSGVNVAVFTGVSCTGLTSCTAVGFTGNGSGQNSALVETLTASGWSVTAAPAGSGTAQLTAVSCPTATDCTAIGAQTGGPLVETDAGGAWVTEAVTGAFGGNAISCPTTTSCTSVGIGLGGGGTYAPLVSVWDGSQWTSSTLPEPVGATYAVLNSVSCSAPTTCTAVGESSGVNSTSVTLVEAES